MDDVFRALADPTRRRLLDRLRRANGETLTELCRELNMSRQAVMKHLAALEKANLVTSVKRGREKFHYLNPVPIAEIFGRWVSRYEQAHVDALVDLRSALEDRTMDRPSSHYVTYINATPEEVWRGLTNPEFTRRYWGGLSIVSDWHVGSPVQARRDDGVAGWEGEVLQADEPLLLSYSFHMFITEAHAQEAPSRVTFTIEPLDGYVRLSVTHDGFEPGSATAQTTAFGWPAILSSLKSLLETGTPLPFTRLGFGPGATQQGA